MKNLGVGGGWRKHGEKGRRVDGILNEVDKRHEAYDRMGDKKRVEGDTRELRGS